MSPFQQISGSDRKGMVLLQNGENEKENKKESNFCVIAHV